MREIREAREETQTEFAAELNRVAASLELPASYDFSEVSKRETARKRLVVEDFMVLALLDPKQRGALWVAFGKAVVVGKDAWDALVGPDGRRKIRG